MRVTELVSVGLPLTMKYRMGLRFSAITRRFTTRTLFVVVGLIGACLAYEAHQAKLQREARAWIVNNGGSYHYEDSNLPRFLHAYLPRELVSSIDTVCLDGTEVRDLSAIGSLHKVRVLTLMNTPVDDISPVKHLRCLEVIQLRQTNVWDLSPLCGLPRIRLIVARNTPVSAVDDLQRLSSLKKLCLRETLVEARDYSWLCGALPQTIIAWSKATSKPGYQPGDTTFYINE